MLLSTALAVLFAIGYGHWTAIDPLAERFITPILEQTRRNLPAAGFLPLLAMGLMSLIPHANIGLEVAAVIALFLTQMWPIAAGFRNALKAVPPPLLEMADAFHFSPVRRFHKIELPFGAAGLVWNAMLGMARAWFILMVAETLVQGTHDFRLPGLGSYLAVAVQQRDTRAVLWALATTVGIIVALYLLMWRPLIVWAQKFRLDEEGALSTETSSVLLWWRRSLLLRFVERLRRRFRGKVSAELPQLVKRTATKRTRRWPARLTRTVLVLAAAPVAYAVFQLVMMLLDVPLRQWGILVLAAGVTLGRVLLTLFLATLWRCRSAWRSACRRACRAGRSRRHWWRRRSRRRCSSRCSSSCSTRPAFLSESAASS